MGRLSSRDVSCLSPTTPRVCAWCRGAIGDGCRRDAITCSTSCRQARHRFGSAQSLRPPGATALRFAYADPPYPGKSGYYADHADFGGEVDHVQLLSRLAAAQYDGWALSTSAEALPAVLASCPAGVRVAAWFRGERPTRSLRPLNAWEPVVYFGGRAYPSPATSRRLDALVAVSRPRTTDPHRVIGAKSAAFCDWLFDLLGMLPGDELDDLFPGSGRVAEAWSTASRRVSLEHDTLRRTS
jgi:hypothetical protein